jgi:non-heme Fe2+,alpha-ketoglutarate-dependent halogenase
MPKMLSEQAVRAYHRDGILFPLRAMSAEDAAVLLDRHQAQADLIKGRINQKPHLLFPWIEQIVRHPRILDAVEDVLGPNLLCWSAGFFAKPAGDPGYVSWHQDGTYWGLSSPDVVTAWVALSPSTPESGNMRVIPGTHAEQVAHEDKFHPDNLLSRGQELAVRVDESQAVDVTLQPGEFSLHHVLIFHGSEPNRSTEPRIGLAIRYIPTHVRQTAGERESALLVRGVDDYHHFDAEISPEAEMHPDAVRRHGEIIDRQLRILYAGSKQRGRLGPEKLPAPTAG